MFPNIFRKFPNIIKVNQRFPRKVRRCFKLISINFGSFTFETGQTCQHVISDVLTDLSGVDSEYDTEEFCLDFDFESTEVISDAESVILDEETSQDSGAINDPLEKNYAICV